MIDYLINLDTEIFLWLNAKHALYWDVVMKMASGRLIWVGMYVALFLALWRAYGWRSALAGGILIGLAVTAADQITASVLRPIFERLRPANENNPISELVHIVDGYRGGRYGFPSCHAANTFAVAVFTSLVFNRWKFTIFIFFWALLNCYSRIYLGVHYPGDLLAGTVIGSMCGAVMFLGGGVAVRYLRLEKFGYADHLRVADINGWKFKYRPSDIPIAVGLITVVYILACGGAMID